MWSEQFIGAFGPVLRMQDGSVIQNAYVERPQIYADEKSSGVPVAFFVGMGTSSYTASISWSQLFCTKGMDPSKDCGPTIGDWPASGGNN